MRQDLPAAFDRKSFRKDFFTALLDNLYAEGFLQRQSHQSLQGSFAYELYFLNEKGIAAYTNRSEVILKVTHTMRGVMSNMTARRRPAKAEGMDSGGVQEGIGGVESTAGQRGERGQR